MTYILDTCIFRELLDHLPKKGIHFEKIWQSLEEGFSNGDFVSVDECFNELMKSYDDKSENVKWLQLHKNAFLNPTNKESLIIRDIFKNKKMQEAVHTKNIIENRPAADVYIIAKAEALNAIIVTKEKYKNHSAQIPNICESRNIRYINYDDFMEMISNL